jgi:hypothetical protein
VASKTGKRDARSVATKSKTTTKPKDEELEDDEELDDEDEEEEEDEEEDDETQDADEEDDDSDEDALTLEQALAKIKALNSDNTRIKGEKLALRKENVALRKKTVTPPKPDKKGESDAEKELQKMKELLASTQSSARAEQVETAFTQHLTAKGLTDLAKPKLISYMRQDLDLSDDDVDDESGRYDKEILADAVAKAVSAYRKETGP